MPYCSNCGSKLIDSARFCPYCGTRAELSAPSPYAPPLGETEELTAYAPAEPEEATVYAPAEPEETTVYAPAQPEEPAIPAPAAVPGLTEETVSAASRDYYSRPADIPEPRYAPPVTPEPAAAPGEKADKVPLFSKKPLSIPRRLLAGLLCVLLLLCSLSAGMLGILRMSATEEGITALVMELDLSEIPARTLILDAAVGENLVD